MRSKIISLVALTILVGTAMFVSAGPIKGLVDIGTGLEVPDADLRYAPIGGSGLSTNDSPVMAAGTEWTFALANVTNDATNATMVVNWQTMTNYVANLPSTNLITVADVSDLDIINTSQEAIAFAASSTQDWTHTSLAYDTFAITRGRIWVANTNNTPFDVVATMTWYVDSDRHGEDALYRADIGLVQVLASGASTAPTNTITVDDASSFSVNDLVVVYDADSTEYGRIAVINANDLTFEDELQNNVDDDAGVSRVGEYGGFSMWGTNKTVWARVTFSSGQTVDLSNWLEYKK